MNHLTSSDINYGPLTIGRWTKTFSARLASGHDDKHEAHVILVAFGWALRLKVWNWMCRPWCEGWVECDWDAETVKRLGRSGYWRKYPREFGFSLSDMGNGYDFIQVFYGPRTHSSDTTKSWSKFLPWKQWDMVRHSIYAPDGELFASTDGRRHLEFFPKEEACPKSSFRFQDYDGETIVASCMIEEREWHCGTGWFKWMRWFFKAKKRRSLDIKFSAEVGPDKGSWKGGIIGHGIDMVDGETARDAFERYCRTEHTARHGRRYLLKFIGPYCVVGDGDR